MNMTVLVGAGIILLFAVTKDADGTLQHVTAIIKVLGITWVFKSIVKNLNKDYGDWLKFVGWSLAGVSAIIILKDAREGAEPIIGTAKNIVNGITSVGDFFTDIATKIENFKISNLWT